MDDLPLLINNLHPNEDRKMDPDKKFIKFTLAAVTFHVIVSIIIILALIKYKFAYIDFKGESKGKPSQAPAYVLAICFVLCLIISVLVNKFKELGKSSPINYIVLALLTFSECYIYAVFIQLVSSDVYFQTFFIFAFEFCALTGFAIYWKRRFSFPLLAIAVLSSTALGLILLFLKQYTSNQKVDWITYLINFVLALSFGLYVVFRLDKIMSKIYRGNAGYYVYALLRICSDYVCFVFKLAMYAKKKRIF